MNPERLKEILAKHKAWLAVEPEGERANLSEANLRRANLWRANLSGADLRRANLSEANLSGADLSEANLSEADLRRANLSEADLRRANLSEADLWRANLRRANLSEAKGLISITTRLWTAYVGSQRTIIGCKRYSNEEWRSFSDEQIADMDSKALAWWSEHKALIFAAMDCLEAQAKTQEESAPC